MFLVGMKKLLLCMVFTLISAKIGALPFLLPTQIGFIPFGIAVNTSECNNISFDVDVSLLYFSAEIYIIADEKDTETGLGITWIPIHYRFFRNNHYWSFINCCGSIRYLAQNDFEQKRAGETRCRLILLKF